MGTVARMSDDEPQPSDVEQLYQELLRKAEAFAPTAADSAAAVLRAEVRRLRTELTAERRRSQEQFLARADALRLADARTKERDEMRRLGREAEMERDTLAHANELLRSQVRHLELDKVNCARHVEHLTQRVQELYAERDEARDALRRHLAGQLLPADAYPWLDEEQP